MLKAFAVAMVGSSLSCLAPVAEVQAHVATAALEARVDGGTIRGASERGVITFKGIPYAAPPLGALRWAPPQPVKPWTGVRPALKFGADCAQLHTPGDTKPLRTVSSENCLYINVWRPKPTFGHHLPVMVWIYGGAFVDGGASPAAYDGTEFARDGVVLVTFNYRLGNFGFFAFPALSRQQAGGLLGNYGYMDQIAALQWVQRNAASFGGDPHSVTIFGDSAGGISINALLLTPLARGLFARAIIESGGGRGNILHIRPLSGSTDSAQALGVRLARHLGIEGEGASALTQLRALPAAALVDGLNMATVWNARNYVGGPLLDGRLELGAPTRIYEAGGGARVPVMIGTTTSDLGLTADSGSATDAGSLAALWRSFGPDSALARRVYDSDGRHTLEEVSAAVGGDLRMGEPARAIARLLSARGQRVYEYRFGYIASPLRSTASGAPHASEVPLVFDTVAAYYGKSASQADEAMARVMHAYWVAFARTGRPDPPGEPAWPEYHESTDELMSFTQHGPVPEADPWKTRLDLAERAAERQAH